MIYSELVRKAMVIAEQAHHGQTDKAGYPYIHHPLHLAEQMETELETVVALLHDVAEDTEIGFDAMAEQGIPAEAIASLRLLCHDDGIPYQDYIDAMRDDVTALRVKRADLLHNLDASRLPPGMDVSHLHQKYHAALRKVDAYLLALASNKK